MKVGKQTAGAFYVHKSAVKCVDMKLQHIIERAMVLCPTPNGENWYDLIKVSNDKKKVSFLEYKNFNQDPHPALLYSWCIDIEEGTHTTRNYLRSKNPPILHRKDSLVAEDYPHYKKFASLTKQEENHGLLNSGRIGYRNQWEALLAKKNLTVIDHTVEVLKRQAGASPRTRKGK